MLQTCSLHCCSPLFSQIAFNGRQTCLNLTECSHKGKQYSVGQQWAARDSAGNCRECRCTKNQGAICTHTFCLQTCANPVPIPGKCCPYCGKQLYQGGREYEWRRERWGTTVPPQARWFVMNS